MSSERVVVQIADQIRGDWKTIPALSKLRVLAASRNVDITAPTALIRQKTVARFPEAPKTHRVAGLLLTIVSPREDFDAAAADLDGWVYAALDYLDTRFRPPEEATEVEYNNRLAYDIPFTAITAKE